MKFKSEVGFLTYAATVTIIFICVFEIYICCIRFTMATFIAACITLAILLGIFLPIFLSTYYCLTEDTLIAKSGFIRYTIKYDNIISISKTNNPTSAPALSLNRLEIIYIDGVTNKAVLISPKNRKLFLKYLKSFNPQIKISDDLL